MAAPTFSLGSLVGSADQDGWKPSSISGQRKKREEPASNDFICKSFWSAVGFRIVTLARE